MQELVTVQLPKKPRLKGFIATVATYAGGTLTATVKNGGKVVMKGAATATAAGNRKPTRAGRKLRRAAKAKLTIVFAAAGKTPQTVVKTIRLVR